ncbi:MAG: hypothetical protein KAI99_21775 [Cyclobacteriaceae bacterium]|nr:hypothetical protein [Cyclobacteriaceae bacterium]
MIKSSKYYDFGLWFVIGCSIGLTAYSTWCGLGLTYDSFDYQAASESFRENGVFTNHNGTPYNFHAPLFPVLLSFLGEDPNTSFVLLNTVTCTFTLLLLFISTRKFFSNNFLYLLGYISISLNVGFQMIHHFLWTEPIFLLLFVIHNYLLLRFFEKERKADFWILVSIAFLMGITKNTGFFIILITSGIILLFSKKAAFNKSAVYILLSSFGFVVWNIYVFACRNGEQMFRTNEFLQSIDLNFFNYLNVISQWFLPGIIPVWFRLLLLAFILIIFFKLFQKEKPTIQVRIFLIQFLAYLIIMIVVIKVDKDEIERLLAIVAPWLILAIFMIIDINWNNISNTFKRLIIVLLILWVSYIGFRSIYNSLNWHKKNCSTEKLSSFKNEFY